MCTELPASLWHPTSTFLPWVQPSRTFHAHIHHLRVPVVLRLIVENIISILFWLLWHSEFSLIVFYYIHNVRPRDSQALSPCCPWVILSGISQNIPEGQARKGTATVAEAVLPEEKPLFREGKRYSKKQVRGLREGGWHCQQLRK